MSSNEDLMQTAKSEQLQAKAHSTQQDRALGDEEHGNDDPESAAVTVKYPLLQKIQKHHSNLPVLRRMPLPALGIISLLVLVNVVVWVVVAIVLAIDLMTRRLLASGKQCVTVGTWFSLGHSTIVIITSIVVAATAGAVSDKFDRYSSVGGIIGTSISAAFLLLLSILNAYILFRILLRIRQIMHTPISQPVSFLPPIDPGSPSSNQDPNNENAMMNSPSHSTGILFPILRGLFRLIDRPWKMYPLGVLFGLGFDTSSEIALLGISSIEATRGTSFWLILLFPLLFTAGMCLLDTTDGALMLSLYVLPEQGGLSPLARDPLPFLYYSGVLTFVTVFAAAVIGIIQVLTLVVNVKYGDEGGGQFWDGVRRVGDNYDVVGGGICGAFLLVGVGSVIFFRRWKRWVERCRRRAEENTMEQPRDDRHEQAENQ